MEPSGSDIMCGLAERACREAQRPSENGEDQDRAGSSRIGCGEGPRVLAVQDRRKKTRCDRTHASPSKARYIRPKSAQGSSIVEDVAMGNKVIEWPV